MHDPNHSKLLKTKVIPTKAIHVDLDLIRKYSARGPRYTSYPPATQFNDSVKAEMVQEEIRINNETDRPLSLYFHLPFCKTLCWFCGCTTVITSQQKNSNLYLQYLEKELDLMGRHLNSDREVIQIHLGGGTPTFLLPEELRHLGQLIHSKFNVSKNVEAGVEMDPRRLEHDHVKALRDAGFNRASFGVQDNNPEVQKAVHRIQPLELTRQAIEWIRMEGFKSVNIDLIYGLPHQNPNSFNQTLDEILELKPDRFAVFNYAHVPWIAPAQKIIKEETLPNLETTLELLKLIIEKLTGAGYVYIGMDHFARPEDELVIAQKQKSLQRNFQGYSTCKEADIYSYGMSSISQIPSCYWQNLKNLDEYYLAIDEGRWPFARGCKVTAEDEIRRTTIMRLMCDLELNFSEMSARLNLDFKHHFKEELTEFEDMQRDNLLILSDEKLEITDLGRLLIRNIAMKFDTYLRGPQSEGQFSRTI